MERYFRRWILNIAKRSEKQHARYYTGYRSQELGFLSHSLIMFIGFSFCAFVSFGLLKRDIGVSVVMTGLSLWALVIHMNVRFFRRMRKWKKRKQAKQRMRWMLKKTPYVTGFFGMISVIPIPGLIIESDMPLKLMYLFLPVFYAYTIARVWVYAATIPLHSK